MRLAPPGSFGAHLKSLREAAGFTQEELAAIAGLSVHAVGALERGERQRPQFETVRSLSMALDLTGNLIDLTLDAAAKRYRCRSYRFGDLYARKLGSVAVFASHLELQATMDDQDWSGQFWVTDVWRKSGVRRSWTMVERVLSRPDVNPEIPAAIRSLQLWR